MPNAMFEKHQKTLTSAVEANRERGFWSAYAEVPSGKFYGESAKDDGAAAFKARLNTKFELDQPGAAGTVGSEVSPYGMSLAVQYPRMNLDQLMPAVQAAMPAWREATVEQRVGVCLEMLARLNQRSFELANAVMHTTGQGFMMAFQAGGPHAQDRGLEAVAYAYEEMKRYPTNAQWEKKVSKTDVVRLDKRFRIVPRGIAVTIGCSTFPTWNSYPGMFASLATGNAAMVKPHPGATLPLAITVDVMRGVLAEAGFDANLVTLVADDAQAPIAKDLVVRPEVKIVDYTGGSAFGEWIEQNARQAVVFTEKAGVNAIILDGVDDLKAVTGNLAFSLSLYSGQMCTTPQNIYIPQDGITVGGEKKGLDEVAAAIVGAVNWFLGDPARAAEVLGAIQNERTAERIAQAKADGGTVLRASEVVANERFPEARAHSPLILQVDGGDRKLFMREMFGPIVYIVKTSSTQESVALAAESARDLGAITCGVYATDDKVLDEVEMAMTQAGVPVSSNLTGHIFVNQSAAFSDFHVSGCNPSGNATLCDGAFVSNRFRVLQTRRPVSA